MKDTTETKPVADAPAKPRRGMTRRLAMIALPLAILIAGTAAWLLGGRQITTDNAYVHQPLVPVSADVSGRIVGVFVRQDQEVRAGAPLFQLDDAPYRIALARAEAALDEARQSVAELRAKHATAQARLEAAEAISEVRNREMERQRSLAGKGVSASSALDDATVVARAAKSEVALAEEELKAATALGGDPAMPVEDVPAVRAAVAERDAAARDLSLTLVKAPVDGVISQTGSLNVGQYLAPGATAASIAEAGDTWVEANLKETQLDGLGIGGPVEVEIDAYPGLILSGTVESIGQMTGSQLSLIPAQNATGNWVKVVQRLPVRIRLTAPAEHALRGGMSAHVAIDRGHSRLGGLL